MALLPGPGGGTAEPSPPTAPGFRLPVEEVRLGNGMRVLLAPRPGAALVGAAWATRRGSGDEHPDEAGVAHLVEHLLHQGSSRVSASDYARLYTEAGAIGIDARTDRDLSVYFLRLPANQLELWFWLESDRLLRPAFSGVERELGVIAEERRQRLESQPTGLIEEDLERLFWADHPYAWPAAGTPETLARLRRAEAERFFTHHYGAGELTAALVGDFAVDHVRELAERYFGRLPARGGRGADEPTAGPGALGGPPVAGVEVAGTKAAAPGASGSVVGGAEVASDPASPGSPAAGERLVVRTCACPTQARILYRTVPAGHPDRAALDVLAGVLAGRGGRLHRNLVLARGVAFGAGAFHEAGRQGGSFTVEIEAARGAPAEVLVEAWDAELARLEAEPPDAAEMERVRNRVATDAWRGLREPLDLALRLLVADAQEGWRALETWPAAVRAVDAASVQRVAREYLRPGGRVVARLTREEAPR
jgi:zinc protease